MKLIIKILFGGIILSTCLFGCTNASKHDKVVIKGYLKGYSKGDIVNYYLPIDGYSNLIDFNTTPVLNDSGLIIFSASLNSFGFIKIQGRTKRIYILATNGDEIEFNEEIQANIKNEDLPVIFYGANAEGHNLYNKLNLDFWTKFNFAENLLLNQYSHKSNLYDSLIKEINVFIQPFHELYNNNKISESFFKIIKSDFENTMMYHILKNFSLIKKNNSWIDDKWRIYLMESIQRKLYENIINKDSSVLKTNFGQVIIGYLLSNHENIYPNRPFPVIDTFVYNNVGVYKNSAYLSDDWLKYRLGDILLVQIANHGKEFEFEQVFSYYIKKYPESGFIKAINGIIDNQHGSSASVKANRADSAKIHILDSTSKINSLKDLISTYTGKAVFIDLWATWCIPCKQEFQFKNQVDALLKENNVEMLYISIDDKIFKDTWRKNIFEFGLYGDHIIAGKYLQLDISNKIYNDPSGKMLIPRYILINSKGVVVNKDMPRPSANKALKDAIINGLK